MVCTHQGWDNLRSVDRGCSTRRSTRVRAQPGGQEGLGNVPVADERWHSPPGAAADAPSLDTLNRHGRGAAAGRTLPQLDPRTQLGTP